MLPFGASANADCARRAHGDDDAPGGGVRARVMDTEAARAGEVGSTRVLSQLAKPTPVGTDREDLIGVLRASTREARVRRPARYSVRRSLEEAACTTCDQWIGAEYAKGPGSSTRKPSGPLVTPKASVSWRSPSPLGRTAKIW